MKPIFNKKPLTPNALSMLPVGSIKPEGWMLRQLEPLRAALASDLDAVWPEGETGWPESEALVRAAAALDGLIAVAWTLDDAAMKERATALCARVLSSQREDGWFGPEGNEDYWPLILLLKALRQFFLATGEKRVLMLMDRFFKFQFQNLETRPLCDRAVARGGENMELALWLYNITEQKHLLELCRRLRAQTLDWTNHFHTFSNTVPMSKSLKWARLEEALADEADMLSGEKRPYFRTQFHLSDGVSLASGLRTPGVINLFKSGFKEQGGFKFGWDKLVRHHGVANGMFVADEHLNGNNPSQGTGLEAAAALMETLETLIGLGDFNAEQADILEKIAYNALAAGFSEDMRLTQAYQQVNQVKISRETRRWYNAPDDANLFDKGLTDIPGVLGAWPKFVGAQWYATADGGLQAIGYAPCAVRATLGNVPARIRVSGEYPFGQSVTIEVSVRQPCEFPLYLRVPQWARQPMIYLPEGEIMQVRSGDTTCVRRRWRTGDTVRLELPTVPRVTKWFHQSGAVELGPLLMAWQPHADCAEQPSGDREYTPAGPWNWALVREEPMKAVYEEGEVNPFGIGEPAARVLVKAVPVDWPMDGASAATVPMVPRIDPEKARVIELEPYGGTLLRVAQFPLGRTGGE